MLARACGKKTGKKTFLILAFATIPDSRTSTIRAIQYSNILQISYKYTVHKFRIVEWSSITIRVKNCTRIYYSNYADTGEVFEYYIFEIDDY